MVTFVVTVLLSLLCTTSLTGSMVPFSLRLLHAQLPGYQSYPQLSLDRLCDLQTVCDQVLAELSHGRLPGLPHPLTSHDQQGIYTYCACSTCSNSVFLMIQLQYSFGGEGWLELNVPWQTRSQLFRYRGCVHVHVIHV